MSPSQLRWKSCRRKKGAYDTYLEAKAHADRVGGGLKPYPCAFCPKYHVGHPTSIAALRSWKRRHLQKKRFGGKRGRYAVRAA